MPSPAPMMARCLFGRHCRDVQTVHTMSEEGGTYSHAANCSTSLTHYTALHAKQASDELVVQDLMFRCGTFERPTYSSIEQSWLCISSYSHCSMLYQG